MCKRIVVLGCGRQHVKGAINVDVNKDVCPDVLADAIEYLESCDDNSLDGIIAWHILEHFGWDDIRRFIREAYRASKPDAVWNIRVPHCTSIHAANPQHISTFSTTFWHFWTLDGTSTGERYGDELLEVESCKLRLLALATGLTPRWIAMIMPNWIFNFNRAWQMFCERFWLFRFDEIEWLIKVKHDEGEGE